MKRLYLVSYDLVGRWEGYVRANSPEEATAVISLTDEDQRQTIADAKWRNEQVVEVPEEHAEGSKVLEPTD